MKHTIVRYTLAIIGLFSVTSCTDYLDNAPDDILTLDMVFNSKNRTEEWLAGIYDGIPDPYTPMMRNYEPMPMISRLRKTGGHSPTGIVSTKS